VKICFNTKPDATHHSAPECAWRHGMHPSLQSVHDGCMQRMSLKPLLCPTQGSRGRDIRHPSPAHPQHISQQQCPLPSLAYLQGAINTRTRHAMAQAAWCQGAYTRRTMWGRQDFLQACRAGVNRAVGTGMSSSCQTNGRVPTALRDERVAADAKSGWTLSTARQRTSGLPQESRRQHPNGATMGIGLVPKWTGPDRAKVRSG
jgi:hypothetical protein